MGFSTLSFGLFIIFRAQNHSCSLWENGVCYVIPRKAYKGFMSLISDIKRLSHWCDRLKVIVPDLMGKFSIVSYKVGGIRLICTSSAQAQSLPRCGSCRAAGAPRPSPTPAILYTSNHVVG